MNYLNKDNYIQEYFGCECGDIRHVICLSYFPPEKHDPDEESIYLCLMINQWRTDIIPYFIGLKDLKEIFTKEFWKDIIDKDFWLSYFYSSIWKRIFIGIKYLLTNSQTKNEGILDSTIIRNQDLTKLYSILNYFQTESLTEEAPLSVYIENKYYQLEITYEINLCPNCPQEISTKFNFKKKNILKRLWISLKYVFNCNGKGSIAEHFEINKKQTLMLKKMIEEIMNYNSELELIKKEEE